MRSDSRNMIHYVVSLDSSLYALQGCVVNNNVRLPLEKGKDHNTSKRVAFFFTGNIIFFPALRYIMSATSNPCSLEELPLRIRKRCRYELYLFLCLAAPFCI